MTDHPLFISFADPVCTWGILRGKSVVRGCHLLDGRHASLRAVLAAGESDAALAQAATLSADTALDMLTLLPVIPDPAHILCAGLNYADHAAETGNAVPEVPRIFLRAPSSMIGHGAALIRPKVSAHFDFEGEIVVVIGRGGRHIPEGRAMDHVAGYTAFMDGSIRDWQKVTTTLGKNFHATGALGPALLPASRVPDWRGLSLTTRLNGQIVQHVGADRMVYAIPAMIAFLSQMLPLEPGDLIATGTPEGIGARRSPPLWLQPGDVVEVEVPGVGTLRNPVQQEDQA